MYEDFPWVFVMDAAYKAVKDPVKIIVNILHKYMSLDSKGKPVASSICRMPVFSPTFAGGEGGFWI